MINKAIAYIAIKRDPLATIILFIKFLFVFEALCVAQLAQIDILRADESRSGPTGTLNHRELSQSVLIALIISAATHHVQFLALPLTAEKFVAAARQDVGESGRLEGDC